MTNGTWTKHLSIMIGVKDDWEESQQTQVRKIQAPTRFEPMTSATPVQRSINWANKRTGSWSLCCIQINFPSSE